MSAVSAVEKISCPSSRLGFIVVNLPASVLVQIVTF